MNKKFNYVGTIDSRMLNEANNNAINEIEKLNLQINKVHSMQEEYEFIENVSYSYMEKTLNKYYSVLDNSHGKKIIRPSDFTNIKNTYINSEKNYANKKAIKTTNKLLLENVLEDYIPEDLIIEAVAEEEYMSIKDNDINSIISRNGTPWVREITTDEHVKEVFTTVYVYLPFSITANDYVNEISFSTFPFNTTEVVNIQYMDSYDTNKMLSIDEIKNHKGCIINDYDIAYGNLRNHICLNFDTIKAKVIGVTLKQSECLQKDNNKLFYLGLKDLKISYKEYQSEPIEFSVDYKPSSPEGVHVENIEISYNNAYKGTPVIQIYEVEKDGTEKLLHTDFIDFATSFKTIRFKFIYKSYDKIPNINKIKLFYKNL